MRARIGCAKILGLACLATTLIGTGATAGQVRGTVVDREGKPASGAKVWAAKLGKSEPQDVREGVADPSGSFAIEAGPGRWIVYALRGDEGGRAGWDLLASVEQGKDPAPVKVQLKAPTRLKGRLIDAETGEAIPGGRFALDDGRRVEVDALGRFEVSGLEPIHHEAYPVCPGYERRRILFDTTSRPDAELELRLPRGGKIFGKILDEQGRPIAGAVIGLNTSGTILSGSSLWEKAGDNGRYAYDGKPLGRTARLTAVAPGYQAAERGDIVVLDPSTPAIYDFTLRTQSPEGPGPEAKAAARTANRRNVTGVVIGPDARPVAGAVVRWGIQYGSDPRPETTTDKNGEFRLNAVPDEVNVLSVMLKGYVAAFPAVEAGGHRSVEVELKHGATIRGRVVDDAGNPIEGAGVAPTISNPRPNWGGFVYLTELRTSTDREGKFVLEGMPDGLTCDFVAEGRSSVRQKPLSPADDSKNDVVLLGGGAIRGRVVDVLGKPVRNFRVLVGMPKDAKPGEPVGGYFAGYGGTGLSFTRDDGEFTITGLTAGNLHLLTVIAEDLGIGEVDRVVAGTTTKLKPAADLTIHLKPGHPLRVRVVRKDGKPVEHARVTILEGAGGGGFQWGMSESSWSSIAAAGVNALGLAEFPGLSFDKGAIVVRARGFARARLEWAKGEDEPTAILEPESKITGTVLDQAGRPLQGATIMLSSGNGEQVSVSVDGRDGRFLAEGLAAGRYTLRVVQDDAPAPDSRSIDLEPGKTIDQDIRVDRKGPAKVD